MKYLIAILICGVEIYILQFVIPILFVLIFPFDDAGADEFIVVGLTFMCVILTWKKITKRRPKQNTAED